MRELKNIKKVRKPNDLVRRRKDKARRTRAGERREDEEGEGDSGKTGRVTFISGPTVCFPSTGFGDEVKGESRTGHIKVFWRESPSYGSIFLFAWV